MPRRSPIVNNDDLVRLRESNSNRLMDNLGVQWHLDYDIPDNLIAAYDASVMRSKPKSQPKHGHDLLNSNAVPCPHCHHYTTYIHHQIMNWTGYLTEIEIGGRCKKCNAEFNMTLIPFNG